MNEPSELIEIIEITDSENAWYTGQLFFYRARCRACGWQQERPSRRRTTAEKHAQQHTCTVTQHIPGQGPYAQ